jgi:hypothetical protein
MDKLDISARVAYVIDFKPLVPTPVNLNRDKVFGFFHVMMIISADG